MNCCSLLSIFNSSVEDQNKLALIVTDSDFTGYSKITSLIQSLWSVVRYQSVTSSAKSFISQLQASVSDSNDTTSSFSNKSQANTAPYRKKHDLKSELQNILTLKQSNELKIESLLIASNKSLPLHKILHLVHMLYAFNESFKLCGVSVYAIFGHSFLCVLPSGHSVLSVKTGHEGEWCGLIPIGHSVAVTTTGLKWNLTNTKLQFGSLISSSNVLDGSGKVDIFCDKSIIWTMDIKCSDINNTIAGSSIR